ncbi:MAG: PCRF domain-containing protein, partial [Flavobacteriales bacterium]|nr:PCRF domain-containing protein [Flavobacteriales bacterium]
MLDKLKAIKDRFQEVERLISAPDAMSDMELYVQLNKEYKDLGPIVDAYHKYKNIVSNITSSKEILKEEKDEEMREMAKMELDDLLPRKQEMDEEIKVLLIPKEPA